MISLEKRDGCARIGKLEVDGKTFETPLMIDFLRKDEFEVLLSGMDFGLAPYTLKEFDRRRSEILGSKDDRFIIATGLNLLKPRKLVEALIELRGKSFKPLYTPALATPKNLPLLVYFGVDIVDNTLPIVKAYEGIYMLENAEFKLKSMKYLPCECEVCLNHTVKEIDEELLAIHNTLMLKKQIELAKELIRNENLRNFVEAQAKFDPELTAMLRIGDENVEFFQRFNAVFKRSTVYPTTEESFSRPEVWTFFKRAMEAYKPKSRVLLLLPCSARKPYMLSKSHARIRSFLGSLLRGVEEIIISSPMVVPRVFELVYPAMNYDTPVTGHWSNDEVKYVAEKLAGFVERGRFEVIVAHVEGGYRRVVEEAGIDAIFTAEDVTSQKSLEKLRETLISIEKLRDDFDLYLSIFEHMFRYQFSIELFEFADEFKVRGRYPNLELIHAKSRIARIDTNYGMLDIDLPMAEFLLEKGVNVVRIADFEPKGTIFAVGVEEADERIRPNDIVVFYNDRLFGVGRACMTGREMVEADRGYAIEVKRMKKFG
jgi:archaeosine synthase